MMRLMAIQRGAWGPAYAVPALMAEASGCLSCQGYGPHPAIHRGLRCPSALKGRGSPGSSLDLGEALTEQG